MKNVILGLLLGLFATSAIAQDLNLSGDVSVGSRYVYRGLELNDDPTVGISGKLDNILLPGLYVDGTMNTLSTSPVNTSTTRSDVGVGFHNNLGTDNFTVDVSVHRVFNPSMYANTDYLNPYLNTFQNNYNEARVNAGYNFGVLKVYGEVGQIVSTGFSHDTYAAAGVETDAILTDLTVGGLVSGEHYRFADTNRYNNAQVYARYKLWRGLEAEATYSFGGKYVDNTDIDNKAYAGVRYNF